MRPGARALICRLPAGAPALLSEHCERLWLLPPAEVLAELGVEVPALYEPHGRDHAGAGRESSPASRVTGSGEPGPKARRLGPSGSVSPRRQAYRRVMTSLPDPTGWLAWWPELWRQVYSQAAPLPSLAPQALSQPILPGWLFANSINVTEENSSSAQTERDIVTRYSYGRQLGRIVDVLGELIERWPGGVPDDPSVQRFAELRDDIERIKTRSIVRAISELYYSHGFAR